MNVLQDGISENIRSKTKDSVTIEIGVFEVDARRAVLAHDDLANTTPAIIQLLLSSIHRLMDASTCSDLSYQRFKHVPV